MRNLRRRLITQIHLQLIKDAICPEKPDKNRSLERKSVIKLSILSAMKKTHSSSLRKQKSTSQVVDDLDRQASSPLFKNSMSAFFNTTKNPQPTGPKSIRMSSNASMLYPILEEGGGRCLLTAEITL